MNKSLKYFYPVEIISFIYILLTALYILIFFQKVENPIPLLMTRVFIAGMFLVLAFADTKKDHKVLRFIRYAFPLSLIIYWYPETYYMNECIFSNLDHIFEHADQILFGCQPSLEFSKLIPYHWFSELMSFGYFSYFLIIISIALYFYFTDFIKAYKILFITLCSFFIYYILFIILPVVGPQFYFPEEQNKVPNGYFIRDFLLFIQSMGEKPTGAFPSSHVGISLISLMIVYKYAQQFFFYILPVVIILICSTVYIKAHYLIDVIGGFISAPILYWISNMLFKKYFNWHTKPYQQLNR